MVENFITFVKNIFIGIVDFQFEFVPKLDLAKYEFCNF